MFSPKREILVPTQLGNHLRRDPWKENAAKWFDADPEPALNGLQQLPTSHLIAPEHGDLTGPPAIASSR